MMPRSTGEVLMENKVARAYLRRADFDQWGLSKGCLGFRYSRIGQGRQQAQNEACWRRIEALLRGDSSGLAETVERHATRDPGMRGILKRASVVCHPESETQKKIALDTAEFATTLSPTARRTLDTIPSDTTSTVQNTGTGEVTRERRTGLTQNVTGTSSNDDISDDVVMGEDNADEDRAEHMSSAG